MDEYNIWRLELLNLINSKGINYGIIGDCITCVDDFYIRTGGMDLCYAWLNDLSYDEIINILIGKA